MEFLGFSFSQKAGSVLLVFHSNILYFEIDNILTFLIKDVDGNHSSLGSRAFLHLQKSIEALFLCLLQSWKVSCMTADFMLVFTNASGDTTVRGTQAHRGISGHRQ